MALGKHTSSVPASRIPQWRSEYEFALQETDLKTLFKRIEIAEASILNRQEVLREYPDGFSERQEIEMALLQLSRLKKNVLKFA
jgi:hypothetical protein